MHGHSITDAGGFVWQVSDIDSSETDPARLGYVDAAELYVRDIA